MPWNADEILRMAQRIEQRGARYYRQAARLNLAARDLLMRIAAQEDQHYATFEAMRQSLRPEEKSPSDVLGEVQLYLNAMVDELDLAVNRDPAEDLKGTETESEILRRAIQFERDSVLFYVGLQRGVGDESVRRRVDDIIHEEMRHIVWLSQQAKAD